MVKKSRGKKRGIQQFSVKKHRVHLQLSINNNSNPERTTYDDKLAELCQMTWYYLRLVCSKCNLVPFEAAADGQLILCSATRRVIHYVLATLVFSMTIRHLLLTIWCLTTDGMNLNSVLCLCFLMYSFAVTSAGAASSLTADEQMSLINSWQPQLDWIEEETGNGVTIYDRTSDNIKVTLPTFIFHVIAMEFAGISVVFESVSPTIYGLIRSLGFCPSSSGFNLLWRVLLFPIELAVAVATGWVASHNIACGTLSLGLIRIYLSEMRKMDMTDFDGWRKVEKMYVSMRLHNILYMNYLYYALGPVILGISSGIVILLYVSVRPSGLPPFIHYWVPFIAFGVFLIISWLWYDVVTMKREGEEMVENLQSRSHGFLRDLEPHQQKYVCRKARALRAPYMTIGQFSDMTLEGLVGFGMKS